MNDNGKYAGSHSPHNTDSGAVHEGGGGVDGVVAGMEDMVLEEGRLEDTTLNVALDSTQSYYTLNVAEPTERELLSPTSYSHHRPNSLLLSHQNGHTKKELPGQMDNIRFSPEGNEGFLLTTCAAESEDINSAPLSNTPREIDEQLLQRYNYSSSKYQDDRIEGQVLRNSVILRSNYQHPRVESSVASSVKSAVASLRMTPRDPRAADLQSRDFGAADLQYRGTSRDPQAADLQYRGTPRDRDFVAADLQYDESLQSASPRSTGYLTDRATSPSAASVTSLQSVSSQASVTGRRLLEWDYGSDIGYVDGLQTQVEAAQSLSTLEKLAIGNYSDILTRHSEDHSEMRGGGRNKLTLHHEEAMDVDAKMKTFAQSLIRQREFSHQQARQRRKSSSPKRNANSKDIPCDNLNPVIKTGISNQQQSGLSVEKSKVQAKKLRRSCSLSEINAAVRTDNCDTCSNVVRSASNNQIDNPVITSPQQSVTSKHVGTSSNGSELIDNTGGKASLNVDPNVRDQLTRASRQSSKRSMSTSFETVIAADPSASSGKESFDTEDENRGCADIEVDLPVPVMHKWNTQDNIKGAERLNDDQYNTMPSQNRELLLNSRHEPRHFNYQNSQLPFSINNGNLRSIGPSRPLHHISGNSSVPSTSDEESGRRRILERMALRLDQRETGGDTSTLDSVQMIDRAKSFEYIPGESFPIQENSSSYEYLPGHLVPEQRPPTVLNLGPADHLDATLAGPSGSQRTRSESVPSSSRSGANQNSNTTEIMNDQGLDQLAKDLKGKSKELYAKKCVYDQTFLQEAKTIFRLSSHAVKQCCRV